MNESSISIFLKDFGNKVRKVRKSKGLTQAELASDLCIEVSQISRIERGVISTSISTAYHISQKLGISMKELFED